MAGAGFIGASAPRYRKRRRKGTASILAATAPATSELVVGQALQETLNWAVFLDPENYSTTVPGETIADVTVGYTGSTADAAEAFADGESNAFTITVSDTAGTTRLFSTIPRTVVQSAPTLGASLSDQSVIRATGPQTYDTAAAFSGAALVFGVSGPAGVSIDSATGVISLDTDVLTEQTDTLITVTASNSGGSVATSFRLSVAAPIVYGAGITGLVVNPTHGEVAQIGVALTGTITNLLGTETISHRWLADGVAISGATGSSYTPGVGDDLTALQYAPLINGAATPSAASTVRHAPPVAGSLAPVVETQGTGTPTVNLTAGFTGQALVYTETVSWASISGSTLTIDDAVRNETLTITATNSGGQAQVGLNVTITAAPTVPGQIGAPSLAVDGTDQITVTKAADPGDGGTAIIGYDLRYSTDQSSWTVMNDVTSPMTLQGLASDTLYYVQMRAVNAVGAGGWSLSASATTLAGPQAFAATRQGSDLVLTNVPDISPQTFTAEVQGTDLVISFTAPIVTPTPTQVAVIDAANHTGTDPNAGSYAVQIFDLGVGIGDSYTLSGAGVPIGAMVVLLDPRSDVVGGGAAEFERVVFIGASIMEQTFGSNLSTRNGVAEAAFEAQGTQVEVYAHANSGFDAGEVQTLLSDAMAAFPEKTLFFVHAGGNNVTASRPYPGGQSSLQTQLTGLIDIAATRPGSVVISDLSFRDYGDTTAGNEAAGSKPYNDALYLPTFQARSSDLLSRAYYTDGTPVSCLYEWSFENRAAYLSSDNIHPANPGGRDLLRGWLAERLAPLCLGLPAPAQFTRTATGFQFTDNQNGTVTLTTAGTLPPAVFTDNQDGTVQRTS